MPDTSEPLAVRIGTATYSPDDNKLRLYPFHRLDAETYARVKAHGFAWAPKQELFVAGMWTPAREDLLIELCGEIDDEDKTLAERAEDRAERFDVYQTKRTADAERAQSAVAAIVEHIPLGQPILVGHHSERHARRDVQRIENGMRKAVRMWDTAAYWKGRAAGALAHAKYKELPAVRARRIKTIEADVRKLDRADKTEAATLHAWALVDQPEKWSNPGTREERAALIAGRLSGGYVNRTPDGRTWSAYDVLRLPAEDRYAGTPAMTIDEVVAAVKRAEARASEQRARWRAHYENRLSYERAMLDEAGASDLLKPKPRRELLPICNYREPGGIVVRNPYRSEPMKLAQVDMTSAQYAAINKDYKGTRTVDNSHRVRSAMVKSSLVCVFLTDSKTHARPAPIEAKPAEPRAPVSRDPIERAPDPAAAMRAALKAGVQVVTAPQLFPTPAPIVAQMIDAARIEAGHRVLEPSAGTGAILTELAKIDGAQLVAVEINATLAEKTGALCADFLETDAALLGGMFDRIVMNPPFKNADDVAHIMRAASMLRPGGRLVALCANGPRQNEKLRPLSTRWEVLPQGSFRDQGTGVSVALLVIERGA